MKAKEITERLMVSNESFLVFPKGMKLSVQKYLDMHFSKFYVYELRAGKGNSRYYLLYK